MEKTLGCWITLLIFSITHADILKGSASIQLSGPVTKAQSQEVRNIAKKRLKYETFVWLTETKGASIDTLNALHNFHLDNFLDTCLRFCSEENDFRGKMLTTNLIITYEKADSAIMVFNDATDNAARESWYLLKQLFRRIITSESIQKGYVHFLLPLHILALPWPVRMILLNY